MTSLSIEALFESAVKIYLFEDNAVTLTFSKSGIQIRFPTTRRLAEFLDVPHYYILPYFAMMEEQQLVTRAERVGILTTSKGTECLLTLMRNNYLADSIAILGENIFNEIVSRIK